MPELAVALTIAQGLGLRHASDPDHLAAVSTLIASEPEAIAVAALLVLALGTAVSMAALSSAFGYAITRGPVLRRMLAFAPAMGVLTLAFGGCYALGAVGAVPYLL
ncbi:MAG TPA: hypothetical protein VF056_08335 [Thermoleophilaceae bacterium]